MRGNVIRSSRFGSAIALASYVFLVACSAKRSAENGPRDVAAVIIFFGDTTRISAPDTVAVGAPIDVSFSTFAGGCTRAVARDDVTTAVGIVEIRPYDRTIGGGEIAICPADLFRLEHRLHLRLEKPGRYVVRLIGMKRGGVFGPAELVRPLTVR